MRAGHLRQAPRRVLRRRGGRRGPPAPAGLVTARLVVFAGLPGVGKSTLAAPGRRRAARAGARRSTRSTARCARYDVTEPRPGVAAYGVVAALAEAQLAHRADRDRRRGQPGRRGPRDLARALPSAPASPLRVVEVWCGDDGRAPAAGRGPVRRAHHGGNPDWERTVLADGRVRAVHRAAAWSSTPRPGRPAARHRSSWIHDSAVAPHVEGVRRRASPGTPGRASGTRPGCRSPPPGRRPAPAAPRRPAASAAAGPARSPAAGSAGPGSRAPRARHRPTTPASARSSATMPGSTARNRSTSASVRVPVQRDPHVAVATARPSPPARGSAAAWTTCTTSRTRPRSPRRSSACSSASPSTYRQENVTRCGSRSHRVADHLHVGHGRGDRRPDPVHQRAQPRGLGRRLRRAPPAATPRPPRPPAGRRSGGRGRRPAGSTPTGCPCAPPARPTPGGPPHLCALAVSSDQPGRHRHPADRLGGVHVAAAHPRSAHASAPPRPAAPCRPRGWR